METTEQITESPADLKADIAKALDNLAKGIRDPEAAKKACERMDRMREENRKLFGEQNWVVEFIRKMRDGQ
jgi:queuine/archaeosine tRNA-ribosyltransferase